MNHLELLHGNWARQRIGDRRRFHGFAAHACIRQNRSAMSSAACKRGQLLRACVIRSCGLSMTGQIRGS